VPPGGKNVELDPNPKLIKGITTQCTFRKELKQSHYRRLRQGEGQDNQYVKVVRLSAIRTAWVEAFNVACCHVDGGHFEHLRN
jgi:hypothetical protein